MGFICIQTGESLQYFELISSLSQLKYIIDSFSIFKASYSGYVSVDWKQVQDDAIAKVDVDGDGELTVADAKHYWKKVKKILTYNVPSAGGFSLGFLYGLQSN